MGFIKEEENENWLRRMEEDCNPQINNSLLNICANYIANKCDTILIENVLLPNEVSQKIFNFCIKSNNDRDNIENIITTKFNSPGLPLSTLNLRNCSEITDASLEALLKSQKKVTNLNIHNCSNLTNSSLTTINNYGQNITSLTIGGSTQILNNEHIEDENCEMFTPPPQLVGPRNLLKFVLWGYNMDLNLSQYFHCLSYLDLSSCQITQFQFLKEFHNLNILILYNVDLLVNDSENSFFNIVPDLSTQIRHLDISQSTSTRGMYLNPNNLLSNLVLSLNNLKSLDISGTNLSGTGVAEIITTTATRTTLATDDGLKISSCCDIPGLNSRIGNELEYLGLYNSAHDASHRHFIPAKSIAGDKDEIQILNAARAFIDRHEVLEKILNDLFHLFRAEVGHSIKESLRIILLSMERHVAEKHIQISGSASLFYIVKNEQSNESNRLDLNLKKRILGAIVNAMDVHKSDPTMMRNGCLTICHFKIPQDVMFMYEKLVKILLNTVGGDNGTAAVNNHEDFVERIAIYLLNSLACQVEGEQKRLVGELGAIQKMLQLIESRLKRLECDDVMEIAWSSLWNITDETPENCSKFLTFNGMALFLQCLNTFPNRPELLRNMMGLLGNVAEVPALRPHLMTPSFVKVFYELLNSKQDNIEVSYNAAGVLAHILSDGPESWTIDDGPKRTDVRLRMAKNINEWNINSPRNINYRSFTPILKLLNVSHTNECRLWAAWALANLTRVYPAKYVSLLKDESGLMYLERDEIKNSEESLELQKYARITLNNVQQFIEHGEINVTPYLEG